MNEPDDLEIKEAAALREALDRSVTRDHVPDDALEAAALIRYSIAGALDPAAEDRILTELLGARVKTGEARRKLAWFVGISALTATAALVILLLVWPRRGIEETSFPRPPMTLL